MRKYKIMHVTCRQQAGNGNHCALEVFFGNDLIGVVTEDATGEPCFIPRPDYHHVLTFMDMEIMRDCWNEIFQ